VPTVCRPNPWFKGEEVQLTFDHIEELFELAVDMGTHVKAGSYQ
jgi:hypothetical protein